MYSRNLLPLRRSTAFLLDMSVSCCTLSARERPFNRNVQNGGSGGLRVYLLAGLAVDMVDEHA